MKQCPINRLLHSLLEGLNSASIRVVELFSSQFSSGNKTDFPSKNSSKNSTGGGKLALGDMTVPG